MSWGNLLFEVKMKTFFQFTFESESGSANEISTPLFIKKISDSSLEYPAKAVWDTGATSSMISAALARKLTLAPTGTIQIAGVHGVQNARCYSIDIVFGNKFTIPAVKVSEASDFGGFDILVGMDIISKGKMVIDGTDGKLKVCFQFPA
jgi:predicted aspartyl protease